MYKMYGAVKELLKEFLFYIASFDEDLSLKMFSQYAPYIVITIVNVSAARQKVMISLESLQMKFSLKPWHHFIVPFYFLLDQQTHC